MSNEEEQVFRVNFVNDEDIYEIYAKSVGESNMFGFIEVEEILFGEQSQLLVDPSEERLKNEFSGVVRTYVPVSSIIRIDEVSKRGKAKITAGGKGSNVKPFPSPVPISRSDTDKSKE